MSLVKFSPKPLTGRRNWVENFFSDTEDFLKRWDFNPANDVPAVNVKEEDKFFLIEVAAPGMKKEDFKIELDNGVLMITAKAEESKEEKENGYVRREFSYRDFQRSFWMPETVNANDITATYEQGLLKLSIPKVNLPNTSKAKAIQIS